MPPTRIYTLSLHDALPISGREHGELERIERAQLARMIRGVDGRPRIAGLAVHETERVMTQREVGDRKSTRLNSSHMSISYAVFCLKKKKRTISTNIRPARS